MDSQTICQYNIGVINFAIVSILIFWGLAAICFYQYTSLIDQYENASENHTISYPRWDIIRFWKALCWTNFFVGVTIVYITLFFKFSLGFLNK